MSGKNQKDIDRTLSRFAQKDATDETNQPVRLTEDADTGDRVLIFSSEKGVEIQLRYEGESLWISQSQMAELFDVSRQSVNLHLNNIYSEGELSREATCKDSLQVRFEGERKVNRNITLFNLDAIISVGYRVSSKQGTLFRKWATSKLVQFATKGFVVDVERLKAPEGTDHFRELRELIQEIRASEANVYKEVTRICSLCSDYHSKSGKDKGLFFSTVQNKLHYAVTGMTGAEIRLERANANQDSMGLTNWAGDRPTQKDTLTAKNFLGEAEIRDLNRFTGMLLDYFEQELDLGRLVTMQDAETKVDKFITNNDRTLLRTAGRVSKAVADKHAKNQYEIYKEQQRKLAHDASMESD